MRLTAWLPESRGARLAVVGLAALVVAGGVLRLLFTVAWRPAFMGWADAGLYIEVSQGQLFDGELRPAGYPLFLRLLHAVWPSLTAVIVVQHLLGLAAAVLLYLAVARSGAPRALGLVPAAVVALGGGGIFLEHAPISEALFVFLLAVSLYAAVRSLEGGSIRWVAACGVALALAATVRVVAVPLLAVFGLWLLAATVLPGRRRLALAAVGAAGAVAVLGSYYVAEERAVGKTGLSRNGVWNLYGRVAPFADCSTFTPPAGTELLCETTPRSARPLTSQYTFHASYSPAARAFGTPEEASAEETERVAAFARAVVWNQPLDYAREVGAGLLRYVAPESFRRFGGGPSYRDLVREPSFSDFARESVLFNPLYQAEGLRIAMFHYGDTSAYRVDPGLLDALRAYESVTRIQGPLFVLLAVLSVAAPFVTSGRVRFASLLFALVAWALIVVPVATVEFSARTAVPGFGPLAAAAALGGWGVACAVRRRRRTTGPGERAAAAV